MIVHKLIEYLKRENPSGLRAGEADICGHVLAKLPDTQKFEIRGNHFADYKVISYADMLIKSSLLTLPFSECYFEFPVSLGKVGEPDTRATACVFAQSRKDWVATIGFVIIPGDRLCGPFKGGWSIGGDDPGTMADPTGDDVERTESATYAMLVASAIAFMDLKETKISAVVAKDRVNKKRVANGKEPFYSHKVLTITSEAREAFSVKGDAALIARRAHWRRGHLRHLPNKIVPVAPALVRGEGFVSKDYRL